jgi:hypothetical protein
MSARTIARWCIAHLRHIRTNRGMLRNESIRMTSDKPHVVAYSADLSKATDHISNATAGRVLAQVLKSTGAPMWMRAAVPKITGEMELGGVGGGWEGKLLTVGALMGLGPSWTVLSLLVDFAASQNASHDTYAVCGDDLVACWTRKQCDLFEKALISIGLVPNKQKSFRGTGAVFCEQFGRLSNNNGRWELKMRPMIRLGEASGVKSIEGRRGHLVADELRDIAEGRTRPRWHRTLLLVRKLAGRTAKRCALTNEHLAPGLIREGGGGMGQATGRTACVFLSGGPTSTAVLKKSTYEKQRSAARRQALELAPTDDAGERIRETMAKLTAYENAVDEIKGAWRLRCKQKPLRSKEHRKRITCRHTAGKLLDPFELLRSERARRQWGSKVRSKVHHLFTKQKWGMGIRYLTTHTRRVHVGEIPQLYNRELTQLRIASKWGQGVRHE